MRTSISVSHNTKEQLGNVRINDKQSLESVILMLIEDYKDKRSNYETNRVWDK